MKKLAQGYLLVVPWPITEQGGVNQVVLNLYRELEASSVFTPIIGVNSWSDRRPSISVEAERRVAKLRLRAPVPGVADRGMIRWVVRWAVLVLPELLCIARFLRASRIGVVNVHYPSLAALQFVLVRRLFMPKLKLILSFHGKDIAEPSRAGGLRRVMWRRLLTSSDAVVSCSDAQSRAVLQCAPFIALRAHTVHNGIDAEHWRRVRNRAAQVDARLAGRRFILSVAAYESKKGLDTLIEAFHALRTVHRLDIALALVGPDLGAGETLTRLAARLEIAEHVAFCGVVPNRDLYTYYCAADVFCLPSRREPFGIVLLEAGAAKCPIVATRVGGIPEILTHDVTARLVDQEDPDALARELHLLLVDAGLRQRLAEEFHHSVTTRFTSRNSCNAYLQLVNSARGSAALARSSSPSTGNGQPRSDFLGT